MFYICICEKNVYRDSSIDPGEDEMQCPACINGDYPSSDAHRCVVCGVAVHALYLYYRNVLLQLQCLKKGMASPVFAFNAIKIKAPPLD